MPNALTDTNRIPPEGLKVAVTRPVKDFADTADALREIGADPVSVPAIEIDISPREELVKALENPADFNWILFTSRNAVDAVFAIVESISGPRIAAVGPRTADALTAHGAAIDLMPEVHTALGLLDVLPNVAGEKVLLPESEIALPALRDGLVERGAHVTAVTAYLTRELEVNLHHLEEADVVLFSSPSAVDSIVNSSGVPENTRVVCVGPTTTAAAERQGLRIHATAHDHTAESLAKALSDI